MLQPKKKTGDWAGYPGARSVYPAGGGADSHLTAPRGFEEFILENIHPANPCRALEGIRRCAAAGVRRSMVKALRRSCQLADERRAMPERLGLRGYPVHLPLE